MSHSVRLTFRLRKDGDQVIEAITDHDCAVHVEPKPGDDNVVVVDVTVVTGGREPVDGEGQGNEAASRSPGSQILNVRDRHVIRIGNAEYGCVRVLSHEVSPYNWRLVNFGASQQAVNPDLNTRMQAANAAKMGRKS